MGSILERPRSDGTIAYLAKTAIMREGKVHRESRTFDRRPAAATWIKNREAELDKPGAIAAAQADKPTLELAITRYVAANQKKIGRTKAQVLGAIKAMDIAQMQCIEIKSQHIVELAQTLFDGDREASTVGNYLSHLQAVFRIAKPAWGFELDRREMEGALEVTKSLGLTSKSNQRTRRPTLDELDKLMTHFGGVEARREGTAPMQKIILFAIFGTRRQEEITIIKWKDLEPGRVLVRDMKHPGQKKGNDRWCDLVPEAERIIKSMPKVAPEIFPVTADAVSAAFTRACYVTGINTEEMPDEERLHFHDLRHDGVSRLFEMGWTIPQAAAVSAHQSWSSLKRYTHLRQTGDKYANWKWLAIAEKPYAA
jgi:integrase